MTSVGALAARVLATPPRLGTVRLVCVDGPAGSGKTTLAARLAEALQGRTPSSDGAEVLAAGAVTPPPSQDPARPGGVHVAVVHMDDLYEGWAGLDGVAERLVTQVLEPLEAGRPGRYRRFDWLTGRFAEHVDVPVPDVLVVEGCGSAPRATDGRTVLLVWVEAPAGLRLRRGVERDGEALRAEWERWMVQEAAHFAGEGTRARADVVVDGTRPLEP